MATLVAFNPDYIVSFIKRHPVDWSEAEKANLNGSGDVRTPRPAVQLFINLLHEKQDLFTWQEYTMYCFLFFDQNFHHWYWDTLSDSNRDGLNVRLRRNFYVSMIDSLHVWAIIAQKGWYDRCVIESELDATSKVDLLLVKGEMKVGLAIRAPGRRSDLIKAYKDAKRGGAPRGTVVLQVPTYKPKGAGNKRWFTEDDILCLHPDKVFLGGR